jgi:hypothetical protein
VPNRDETAYPLASSLLDGFLCEAMVERGPKQPTHRAVCRLSCDLCCSAAGSGRRGKSARSVGQAGPALPRFHSAQP